MLFWKNDIPDFQFFSDFRNVTCHKPVPTQANSKGDLVSCHCHHSDPWLCYSGQSVKPVGSLPHLIACSISVPPLVGGSHCTPNLLNLLGPALAPQRIQYMTPLYTNRLCELWATLLPTCREPVNLIGLGAGGSCTGGTHWRESQWLHPGSTLLKLLRHTAQLYRFPFKEIVWDDEAISSILLALCLGSFLTSSLIPYLSSAHYDFRSR